MWKIVLVFSGLVSMPLASASCKGRSVLTNVSGIVTDGDEDYPEYARCEWLILAQDTNKTIYLKFESLNTECSYDFLFIYDGDSYNSPLLASLSGSNRPEPVIARSGKMLVYLFSDRNYQRKGFKAHYEIQNCPLNCSNKGDCIDHKCMCFIGRTGEACERDQCPESCGHGKCVMNKDDNSTSMCECDKGYAGFMCNMSINTTTGSQEWYTLLTEGMGFKPRAAHAGAFIPQSGCLYVFGGFTLNEVVGDLKRFCLQRNRWETLEIIDPWPAGRYEHAIAQFEDGFYMFGGVTVNGSYSRELWFYNTTSELWILCANNSSAQPLELSGHSLTTVEDHVYLFGGKTIEGQFVYDMFKINGHDPKQWIEVKPLGGKSSLRRLVGHSTVYHKESKSLLIYGGYSYTIDQARYGTHTENLNIFHVENLVWSLISFEADKTNAPSQRSFHSALIMGNYMVIYGGNTHIHHDLEICYDYEIFLYHLGCHIWVNPHNLMSKYKTALRSVESRGRVSHVAVAAAGDLLLVAGGYAGYLRGDLIAFKFPPWISPLQMEAHLDLDYCGNNTRPEKCHANPDCFYCDYVTTTGDKQCMHRTLEDKCRDRSDSPRVACPGICGQLTTCLSCLSQGQGAALTSESPEKRLYIQPCNWCVKEAKCQQRSKPEGNCHNSQSTVTGMVGWWDGPSASLSQMDQCRLEDYPAGLIAVKYRSSWKEPFTQPDEVEIIRQTVQYEKFRHIYVRKGQKSRILWLGYIHPLNASVKSTLIDTSATKYTMKLSAKDISVNLRMGRLPNSTTRVDEVQKISSSPSNQNPMRPSEFSTRKDGSALFQNTSRGNRYFMALEGWYDYPEYSEKYTSLQKEVYDVWLHWDGRAENGNNVRNFHPFTSEFLEPYNVGDCDRHTNCLACMTDTQCGWCHPDQACVLRTSGNNTCVTGEHSSILITEPSVCPTCADHVECNTCTEDTLCEWVNEKVSCIRLGLGEENKVARHPEQCLPSCHERTNCSSCLNMMECAWCENLHSCMPFADYVSRHRFGQCTEWIDSEIKNSNNPYTCRNCSSNDKCKTCLNTRSCGWCGNVENPTIGVCVDGDFSGPYSDQTCSQMVATAKVKVTAGEPADWSYATCPDVDICALDQDNCHLNATCTNIPSGFKCTCNQGFEGDGVSCRKTCFYKCANGMCLDDDGEYFCDCNLGWTGPDCATDCKCNRHSMCENGTGLCDHCLNGTNGPYCDLCLLGFYGDPKTPDGCFECKCNDHGDESRGRCNNGTGECFCINNTKGFTCDLCEDGYYGDASNGGTCYLSCDHGMVLENVSDAGALGSHLGPGVSTWRAYCLWILTVHADLDKPVVAASHTTGSDGGRLAQPATLTFSIDDLEVDCERDHVYVYDGLPAFVDSRGKGRLLGAFCGHGKDSLLKTVTARSGTITVYFDADISGNYSTTVGFNGSYHVNQCKRFCDASRNQECMRDDCGCMQGYTGFPNCSQVVCDPGCQYDQTTHSCVCTIHMGTTGLEIAQYPNLFPSPPLSSQHFDASDPTGPVARYGHALIHCDDPSTNDVMYLFGGRSLEYGLLNDLWEYNLVAQKWEEIQIDSNKPSPRYFHTGACTPRIKIMYIFGGMVNEKSDFEPRTAYMASSEMWKFDLENRRWTGNQEPVWMKPLAGHTMTLAKDKLVIIGGISETNYFNDNVYIHYTNNFAEKWKQCDSDGLLDSKPIGIYGHSAVYEPVSETIYVFGGHLYRHDSLHISAYLFTYDVATNDWNIIQPSEHSLVNIEPHYFHSAIALERYMVVIGGRVEDPEGPAAQIINLYDYKCNLWYALQASGDIGERLTSTRASSVIRYNNTIYMFGGINGVAMGHLYRITVPEDACQTLQQLMPASVKVCSQAYVRQADGQNRTLFYSPLMSSPPPSNGTILKIRQGTICDMDWHRSRDCQKIIRCSECRATYPQFKKAEQTCSWCNNKCNPTSEYCPSSKTPCYFSECQASTCDKCKLMKCHWSQHLQLFRQTLRAPYRQLTKTRTDWSCIGMSYEQMERSVTQMQWKECPSPCVTYSTCGECLAAPGSEGGAQECFWSEALKECMPPAYMSLHCLGGECGTILQGPEDRCPVPCEHHTKCADCRRAQGCGWCAYEGMNGNGRCMPGTRQGPTEPEMCMKQTSPPGEKITNMERNEHIPLWAYGKCPPENECDNQHHNCDLSTEDCSDQLDGFVCHCKEGYRRNDVEGENVCKPVCHETCDREHGKCVKPDQCECLFGYVGRSCTTKCECNGHSMCASEHQLKRCLQCMNNTQGPQCYECKPLYVGNPRDGGHCTSCSQFCNGHSDICLKFVDEVNWKDDIWEMKQRYSNKQSAAFLNKFRELQRSGPMLENDTKCMECGDNTMGSRCEKCKPGYFRLAHMKSYESCQKCMCNGHSDVCDANTGKNCLCKNNTETRCNDEKSEVKCHEAQCEVCKEYFQGKPTDGHHCYRMMTVNKDYCLDPHTQAECTRNPAALLQGRTVFFVVQPKYVNVDIRVTIDVTVGDMDVYFSSQEDTFVVNVDRASGKHLVSLDPAYRSYITTHRRKRRSELNVISAEQTIFRNVEASSLNTFITVNNPETILMVRKLKGRLVITLPNDKLNLKTSRFYMVFYSTGDIYSNQTFGNLYFRQDQPHIDLFVFFSVFFSCFFLFLAICVLLWKTKQGLDARRSRQQRAREMLHMASRPFAKVLVNLDHPVTPINISPHLRNRQRKVSDQTPLLSPESPNVNPIPLDRNRSSPPACNIVPIALEPTEDSIASVGTLVFQLPGGSLAPTQLCLGSTLIYQSSSGKARRPPVSSSC